VRNRRVSYWRRVLVGAPAIVFATIAFVWITAPDVRPLRRENPPTTAFMDLRAAEARAAGSPVKKSQRWVGYDSISPYLRRAVLIAEDDAFFQHDGVDYAEVRAALNDTIEKGEPLRGASTLTQQLAKNLYLSPSQNPFRKVTELIITRRLEAELTKRRIFELYLNVAEWGDGIWGAEAAARAYFGVAAADVSAEQAALLAGALINPRRYSPAHPNGRLLARQAIILKRMEK
jgi:monofunctional biosynthetic peptidoglycan transglycosylase